MIKKLIPLFVISLLLLSTLSRADEGMWIPMLLKKYNEADMIKKGLKITAEDIYSVNNTSLKDGIVLFGRGCTGEMVSDQGLLLTNHHCGYGQIQAHSSVENDYLTNGFWAMSRDEELPNPGLSVQFLIKMEDVTETILGEVTDDMTELERNKIIAVKSREVMKKATEGNHYTALVKPLFYGNQYFLYVMEKFTDVRLVGAPPSAIGKFGGDTDNWMWPRHTGDFSVFRVYADKDGKPADYSPDNVPLKPRNHFKISLKGVEKDDFTMVYGYPYTTQEYLPSHAVEMILNSDRPTRVDLRTKKLNIIMAEMEKDPKVRIQYSSKYAGVANGWKKWQGVIKGLNRLDAIEKKQAYEDEFTKWVLADEKRIEKYGDVLPEFEKLYKEFTPYSMWMTYFTETIWGIDAIKYVNNYQRLASLEKGNEERIAEMIDNFKNAAVKHFKDYDLTTDKKVFTEMVRSFYDGVEKERHPAILTEIASKHNRSVEAYADHVYEKSIFVSLEKTINFLESYKASKAKKIETDPMYVLMNGFLDYYRQNIVSTLRKYEQEIETKMRLYMKGQMEMASDEIFYPDANATMRVTYGKISDYYPYDGAFYRHYTTLSGIMEKDNPDIYDYNVPDKLEELYLKKDYGKYGKNGVMPVAFTASNHTTGGNSGSPVLNAHGHLIGINFDRNWEGTMSDIMYDPDMCRNISIDIRYCLFIIDKFAGATHLVEEMEIVE